ncbi:MAG: hypothetical protein JWQ88_3105, partial [Rhodoferax sp.]|nr:hypothetical protein [Rhodoferax sp.]
AQAEARPRAHNSPQAMTRRQVIIIMTLGVL